MQVFNFNPITGQKGAKLYDIKRASWTGQSVKYQVEHGMIEPIAAAIPPNTKTAEWTMHVGAGSEVLVKGGIDFKNYAHDDEFICFCLGAFTQYDREIWQWVVLPPKNLVKKLEVA